MPVSMEAQAGARHRTFALGHEAFVELEIVEDHRATDGVLLAEGFPVIHQRQAGRVAVEQHPGAALVAGGRQGDPLGKVGTGGVELAAIEDQLAIGAPLDPGLERELVLAADFRQGVAETFASEYIADQPVANLIAVAGENPAQHDVVDLQQLADAAVGD